MPGYESVSCKYHPESPLIEDHRAGDQICSQCGLVVGDRVIDVSSEWRTFSDDAGGVDKSRVGAAENSLLEGGNLSTMIGPGTGRPGETSYRNYTRPTSNNTAASDRSLINAMRIIAEMADRINLPKVITDRANKLFKMVQDGKHLTGRAHGAIAAACLYIACRQEGVPRTFKEIVSGCDHRQQKRNRPLFQSNLETTCGGQRGVDHDWGFHVSILWKSPVAETCSESSHIDC